jgi:tetratricopeptide (TPR) repeat protein
LNWHKTMATALEQLKSTGAQAAEPLLRQALEQAGETPELKAMTHFNLGLVLYDLKRAKESETSFQQALEILQEVLPKNNELYGMFLKTMTEFYEKENRLADAKKYYLQEIDLTREMYGARHPYVANIICEYTDALIKLNDFAGAEKYLRRALDIMASSRGAHHVQNGPIHANLAKCYTALGRKEDADYHQDRADEMAAREADKKGSPDESAADDEEPASESETG